MTDSLLVAVLDPIYELVLITLVLCMAGGWAWTLAQLFEARREERHARGKVAELVELHRVQGRLRRRCLAPWPPAETRDWPPPNLTRPWPDPDPATRTPTVDEVPPLVLDSWPFDPPAETEPTDGTLDDLGRRWEAEEAAALANRRPLGRLTWDQPPTIDPPDDEIPPPSEGDEGPPEHEGPDAALDEVAAGEEATPAAPTPQPPTTPEIDDYHQRLATGPHTADTPAVTQ